MPDAAPSTEVLRGAGAQPVASELVHVLAGPTASGKSAVALEVARAAGAEILSMDSMLVYRGMDVGTAKPTLAERALVPHHLLDLVEPEQGFSVTDWLASAEESLADVRARGRRALFVGGTAFYLKALVAGLFRGPRVDAALRAELERRFEREGAAALHAELARADPPSAARLHPNDRKRVVRALEVWHQTGRPLSAWQREWGFGGEPGAPERPHAIAALALEPRELEARIAQRAHAMLAAGWADEVRAILARGGFGPTSRQALGYPAVVELVEGRIGAAEAEARIVQSTRSFARKQRTWLRRFALRTQVRAPDPVRPADVQRAASEVLAALGW
jgi:tRNA dimethylallyltransferase